MSIESCAFFLDLIAAIAVAVWVAGAVFTANAARRVRAPVTAEARLNGDPEVLTRQLAEALAAGAPGSPLQRIVLDDVTATTLVWHGGAGVRHAGSLRVAGRGADAVVAWQLQVSSGLITAARWVNTLGGLVIALLYWVLQTYALPMQSGIREQVFQMAQSIHVIWPPFLFAGLALKMKRRLAEEVERLIANRRFASAG